MSKTKNALEYTLRAREAAGREAAKYASVISTTTNGVNATNEYYSVLICGVKAAFVYETVITSSGLVSYTLKRTLDKSEYALERFV